MRRITRLIDVIIALAILACCLIALSSCSSTKSEVKDTLTTHETVTSKDSTVIKILPHSWFIDTTGSITYPDCTDSSDYYLSVDVVVPDNNGIDSHKVTIKVRPKTKEITVNSKQLKPDVSQTTVKEKETTKSQEKDKTAIKTVIKQPSIWEQIKDYIVLTVVICLLIGGLLLYLGWRFK